MRKISTIIFLFLLQTGCFLDARLEGLESKASENSISPSNDSGPKLDPAYVFPADVSITEGGAAVVTFKIGNSFSAPINILYETVPETAAVGVNFSPISGSLAFSAGDTEQYISTSTFDSVMPEGQFKTFRVIWKRSLDSGETKELGNTLVTINAKPDLVIWKALNINLAAPSMVFDHGTFFLYTNSDIQTGIELWRSDGTVPGTFLLKDICAGPCSGSPSNLTLIGSEVFFTVTNSSNETEIWKTDGTVNGTQLVFTALDLATIAGIAMPNNNYISRLYFTNVSDPVYLFEFNGKLILTTEGISTGYNTIYISDGTIAGTQKLMTASNSWSVFVGKTATKLFFSDGALWASDGTQAGTARVSAPSPNFGGPIVTSGNHAFTSFRDGVDYKIIRSDGTAVGTAVLSNSTTNSFSLSNIKTLGGKVYSAYVNYGSPTKLSVALTTGASATLVFTGAINSWIDFIGEANSKALFFSNAGIASALYVSDGTAFGTTKVIDFTEGLKASTVIGSLNNKLFFSLSIVSGLNEQHWISDGSVVGTVTANSFFSSMGLSNIVPIKLSAGKILFWAEHASYGREIWQTDLTILGTSLFLDSTVGPASSTLSFLFEALNLYWWSEPIPEEQTSQLVGTNTTTMVRTTLPSLNLSYSPSFKTTSFMSNGNPNWASFNNSVYYSATLEGLTRELYKLNSSLEVPVKVANFSSDEILVGATGSKFWFSDCAIGSCSLITPNFTMYDAATDEALKFPGIGAFNYPKFIQINDKYLFKGITSTTGPEPAVSDGTIAGTSILIDLTPGMTGSNQFELSSWNNIGFIGDTSKLYKTDGTPAGTQLLLSPPYTTTPKQFQSLTSKVLFMASTAAQGIELWSSDGTIAGTAIVKEIYSGVNSSLNTSFPSAVINNKLFFFANDGISGTELWISDGTSAGTSQVKNINGGATSSVSVELANPINNKFVFIANDSLTGNELWASDGTDSGTTQLADMCPGACGSNFSAFINFKNKLYFWQLVTNGSESTWSVLWQTDGTPAGTIQVADIRPEYYSINQIFMSNDNHIYFSAKSATDSGYKLWRSDGLPGGLTQKIPNNQAFNPAYGFPVGNRFILTQTLDWVNNVITVLK